MITFAQTLEFAINHFVDHCPHAHIIIFEYYGMYELGLHDDALNDFVMNQLEGGATEGPENSVPFIRFYMWYYLNYVAGVAPELQ